MHRADGFLDRLVSTADLQDEKLPGQSLVEIMDNRRVLIEKHQGVCLYEPTMIHVKVRFGTICVCGCNLEIARMIKEQLIITGTVECVKLIRG